MQKDDLGDRMKRYERNGHGAEILLPQIPVIGRLDGRAFHSFTKGMDKPFDSGLTLLMLSTAQHVVEQFDADLGYIQSDEISLVWTGGKELLFGGKIQKMCSSLAAMASAYFCKQLPIVFPEKSSKTPTFDCRVFNVPNLTEAVNCLIFRQQDCVRNSISALAQANFSHKQLQGKDCPAMLEMLAEKGIRWEELLEDYRHGSFLRRVVFQRKFTSDELEKLPEKHEARSNPNLLVTRAEVRKIEGLPLIVEMDDRIGTLFPKEDDNEKV